jgi:hypothetical protein
MAIPLFDSLFKLLATLINSVSGRKERRIKAAAAFRETFLTELQRLYPLPADWPPGTGIEPRLKKVFPTLQSAVRPIAHSFPRASKPHSTRLG